MKYFETFWTKFEEKKLLEVMAFAKMTGKNFQTGAISNASK
jgi:hypothetical protein